MRAAPILTVCLFQLACTRSQDILMTKELPLAKIDQSYSANILMRPTKLDESSFKVETNMIADTGLSVIDHQGSVEFSHAVTVVEGTPKIAGEYYIRISGANREASPKFFSKTYTVMVQK